jgi:hypothetical protein
MLRPLDIRRKLAQQKQQILPPIPQDYTELPYIQKLSIFNQRPYDYWDFENLQKSKYISPGHHTNEEYFAFMLHKCPLYAQQWIIYHPKKKYEELYEITIVPNIVTSIYDFHRMRFLKEYISSCFLAFMISGYVLNSRAKQKLYTDEIRKLNTNFITKDYSNVLNRSNIISEDAKINYIDANQTPGFFLTLLTEMSEEQFIKHLLLNNKLDPNLL